MDYALLSVSSLFTEGVADKEHDTASMLVMVAAEFSQPQAPGNSSVLIAATPVIQPAHEMAAAPDCVHIKSATVEADCKMAATTSPHHVTAAIRESSQATSDLHESSQITADLQLI